MSEINPPAASTRVGGYDLARALAIIGMVMINFPIYLTTLGPDAPGSLGVWLANLHGGRAAALFVTIAGAGIGFMARGANLWAVRRVLLLRSIFLLIAGALLIQVWRIDILHFYGFYLLIAAVFFVSLPRWALLPLLVVVGGFSIALHAGAFAAWGLSVDHPDYGHWTAAGIATDALISGVHPVFPWITYILLGMWLSGLDLTDRGTRGRVIVVSAALAFGAPLVSTALEVVALAGYAPDAVLNYLGVGYVPSPFYLLGAWGSSVLVIAAAQAVFARFSHNLPVKAFVSMGRLALTLYLAHALLAVVMPQHFFGFGNLSLAATVAYGFAFCTVGLVFAAVWRTRFELGPVEMLMRRIAGRTPRRAAPVPPRQISAPARWAWVAVSLMAVGLVGLQAVGPFGRLGCGEPQRLEASATSALSLTCPRQSFAVAVNERADVTLQTRSGHDLYLEVYLDDELVAQNDDGGPGLNPMLTETLEPGLYRALIRPYEDAVGGFVLLREDAPPSRRELEAGEMCTNQCPYAGDGECDDGGPNALYSLCPLGSDCDDCGVRSASDYQSLIGDDGLMCTNGCGSSNDGECDDGGPDSLYAICTLGTDCADCGPRRPPQ